MDEIIQGHKLDCNVTTGDEYTYFCQMRERTDTTTENVWTGVVGLLTTDDSTKTRINPNVAGKVRGHRFSDEIECEVTDPDVFSGHRLDCTEFTG